MEDYPSRDDSLKINGQHITIPKALVSSANRAMVFASEQSEEPVLLLSLQPGLLRIVGEGISGGYEEVKRIDYKGPPMRFLISPDILQHIAQHYTTAEICQGRFKAAQKDCWEYVTVLGDPEKKRKAVEKEEENEE
jgi:hypothetical protein